MGILYVFLVILTLVALWFVFYIICSLFVDIKKEYTENSRFYRAILNGATALAAKVLRIKVYYSGKEKLSKNQNYLFVSNHRSNLDPILSWYVFKEYNIAFISKPENFHVPIFGRIIHRCCFLPIDRTNPFGAIETIKKAAALLKNKEISVGVYPEGKRNSDKEMLPFHNGVFMIAQKANVPIAVVSIENTDALSQNYPFKRTKVHIDVLEVINAESLKGKRTNLIGDQVRQILEAKLS